MPYFAVLCIATCSPHYKTRKLNHQKLIIIMQSKGAIRFVAILLLLASIWQLSFTLVTKIQENKAESFAEAKAVAAEQTAAFAKVAEADKAFYLDSPSSRI